MSKKNHKDRHGGEGNGGHAATAGARPAVSNEAGANAGQAQAFIPREAFHAQLNLLQVELVKLRRHFIGCKDRILVLLEQP